MAEWGNPHITTLGSVAKKARSGNLKLTLFFFFILGPSQIY